MNTTQKVLTLLEQHFSPLSGQEIANKLAISRTAVWKAVKNLRQNGQVIQSKPHSGYLLLDPLSLSETFIKRNLTVSLPLRFKLHDSLDSTNIRAKEIGSVKTTKTPWIIISDQQTKGYGRYGRTFSSPAHTGIYLSILLKNDWKHFNAGLLTTATATALCKTIEQKLRIKPGIKWVNDVLWNEKKVSGILTEGITDMETGNLKQIVVGIGINYLTDTKIFDFATRKRAGSLRQAALNSQVSRNAFIASFLNEFFSLYPDFSSSNFMDEYRKYCTTLGKEVTITQGGKTITGIAEKISDTGALILKDGRNFSSGEITKIRTH